MSKKGGNIDQKQKRKASVYINGNVENGEVIVNSSNVNIIKGIKSGRDIHIDIHETPSSQKEDENRSDQISSDHKGVLEKMGNEFVSQISMVGYFEDENKFKHAIYLDDDLYVRRQNIELELLKHIANFTDNYKGRGKWISVVGDAGHGKSCLLWYIYKYLKEDTRLKVIPFQAQLLTDKPWEQIKETVSQLRGRGDQVQPVVILVDTLDILVGIDDSSLATTLNALRASDYLLITCSRRQEDERISTIVQSDKLIELKRYNEHEAQQAIYKYINISYPSWSEEQKEQQFIKVWGLLDQRRRMQELDFEPLILRMIFETYAPDDIPQDINTQKVYKEFWEKRVILDRTKDTSDQFKREQFCNFLARQIAFGQEKSHSDTFPLGELHRLWEKLDQTGSFPFNIVNNLTSTGVLQWATGRSAIRFFHQTFFEYTAAHDLLWITETQDRDSKIKLLLEDVARLNFFRIPILKQLVIQDFYERKLFLKEITNKLRSINSDLSAQLTLEIIGKIQYQDDNYCIEACKEWIEEEREKFENLICDTVKYYPGNRINIALNLLKAYLNTGRETAIYSLCKESFASVAPDLVHEFLHTKLQDIKKSDNDDKKGYFKSSLCAVIRYGAIGALDDISELLPYLKPGQQKGTLLDIAEITTKQNAAEVALFLGRIFDTIAQGKEGEVWHAFLEAFSTAHRWLPEKTKAMAQALIETDK